MKSSQLVFYNHYFFISVLIWKSSQMHVGPHNFIHPLLRSVLCFSFLQLGDFFRPLSIYQFSLHLCVNCYINLPLNFGFQLSCFKFLQNSFGSLPIWLVNFTLSIFLRSALYLIFKHIYIINIIV